jgi:hypothetical protein
VSLSVTASAQCHPVREDIAQFYMCSKGFNVMRVKSSLRRIPATLASVFISALDRFGPALNQCTVPLWCGSTFPHRVARSSYYTRSTCQSTRNLCTVLRTLGNTAFRIGQRIAMSFGEWTFGRCFREFSSVGIPAVLGCFRQTAAFFVCNDSTRGVMAANISNVLPFYVTPSVPIPFRNRSHFTTTTGAIHEPNYIGARQSCP